MSQADTPTKEPAELQKRRDDGQLRQRIVTALVLVPLLLVAVAIGQWAFLVAVGGIVGLGTAEFYALAESKPYRPRAVAGIGLAVAFPVLFYTTPGSSDAMVMLLTVALFGISMAHLLDSNRVELIAGVAVTILGALYIGILLGHMILVREIAREIPGAPYWTGAALLTIPLALTWVNDGAAYFVGIRYGRRRLLPSVSPGKSVEGAVGAWLITVVAAIPVVWIVNQFVPIFSTIDMILLGLLIGAIAPCGDLIESAFKRDAGVKDSSDLIPGHGGILDRFDSLLVTVPLFYYYTRVVVL